MKQKSESKINLIFLHKLFKAIADSIITVFIPVYILNLTQNLLLAMGYLCFFSLFVIFFNFVLKKFLQRFSVIAIILHFIPIIAAEIILNFCACGWLTISAVALLMALAQVLYSVPLNLIFLFGDESTNVAKFQVATNVGKLIFMLISGYILANINNSFLYLCIASSIFYIVCVIPIWFGYKLIKSNYDKLKKSVRPAKKNKTDKFFALFHISFGTFQSTMDKCLPIFLYVNNLSFQAVTFLMALIELFNILANYIAKFLVSKTKTLLCFIMSFVIFISSIICIMFVKNNIVLYVASSLCSIAFPFTFVPAFKMFCSRLKSDPNCDAFEEMTNRDLEIFSFRPILYSASMIGLGMIPTFALGMIATISMFVCEIKIDKLERQKEQN